MDSTPPSHRSNPSSLIKPVSRLSRITYSVQNEDPPHLSLDLITATASPKKKSPSTPSSLSLKSSTNSLPPHDLLLLLSPSPRKKSRTRLVERLEMAEDETTGSRRRRKSRGTLLGGGGLGCASPRNSRKMRRRSELEMREERDLSGLMMEEIGKVKKKRQSGRLKKDKLSLVPSLPSSISSPKGDDADGSNLDRIGLIIYDLIMWKDVAKSSLWFGFSCLCFLSSCFAKGVNFSIFATISQLGLLFLGASFFSNSVCQRNNVETARRFKLNEEDILRAGRLILPAANLAISKIRELFSGEPSMTLKVIPYLLLGAEYGHHITLRRLCGIGFFISFTIPKLYSLYSGQINRKVEHTKSTVLEAWGACSHKKMVAASAITAFWNLSSVKTRIFAAFISLVILRCSRQRLVPEQEEEEKQEQLHQALVVVEEVSS